MIIVKYIWVNIPDYLSPLYILKLYRMVENRKKNIALSSEVLNDYKENI